MEEEVKKKSHKVLRIIGFVTLGFIVTFIILNVIVIISAYKKKAGMRQIMNESYYQNFLDLKDKPYHIDIKIKASSKDNEISDWTGFLENGGDNDTKLVLSDSNNEMYGLTTGQDIFYNLIDTFSTTKRILYMREFDEDNTHVIEFNPYTTSEDEISFYDLLIYPNLTGTGTNWMQFYFDKDTKQFLYMKYYCKNKENENEHISVLFEYSDYTQEEVSVDNLYTDFNSLSCYVTISPKAEEEKQTYVVSDKDGVRSTTIGEDNEFFISSSTFKIYKFDGTDKWVDATKEMEENGGDTVDVLKAFNYYTQFKTQLSDYKSHKVECEVNGNVISYTTDKGKRIKYYVADNKVVKIVSEEDDGKMIFDNICYNVESSKPEGVD